MPNQASAAGNGGNGLVVIYSLTALPSVFTGYYSGGTLAYTVPTGIAYLLVKMWGAGGGGSTVSLVSSTSYGGGAGGYSQGYLAVSAGQQVNVRLSK